MSNVALRTNKQQSSETFSLERIPLVKCELKQRGKQMDQKTENKPGDEGEANMMQEKRKRGTVKKELIR